METTTRGGSGESRAVSQLIMPGVDLCDETIGAGRTAASASFVHYCGRNAVTELVDSTGRERFLCAAHSRRVASVFASAIKFDEETF